MIYGIHGIGRMGAFSWLWVRPFEWFESLTTNGLPTPIPPPFALREPQDRPFESLRTGPSRASGQALREPQDRPFESLRTGPSRASGQALREPQDRPFERPFESLRTGPSRASGQALREPQDRPFESLRTGPSRASGQALREPQDRPFESLRTGSGRTGRDGEIPALAGNAFLDYINGLDPSPTDARKGAMLYSLLADRRHFGEDFHA